MNSLICTMKIQNTKVITVEMGNSKYASINLLKVQYVITGNVKFKLKLNLKHIVSKQEKGGMKLNNMDLLYSFCDLHVLHYMILKTIFIKTTLLYKYLPSHLGMPMHVIQLTHAYNYPPCTRYSYFTMCLITLCWQL